jgi:hypothetical protein
MANLKKGQSVTLADTTAVEYVLVQATSGADCIFRTAATNSGTIQFAVSVKGVAPSFTGATAYAADKPVFLRVGRNESLWAKASGASQSFSSEY